MPVTFSLTVLFTGHDVRELAVCRVL